MTKSLKPRKIQKEKEFICQRCHNTFYSIASHKDYCDTCRPIVTKEYTYTYNRMYNATRRFNTDVIKREYKKTKLKRKEAEKIEVSEFVKYCEANCDTITGCLNCICDDCIQNLDDKPFPWEKEGFNEDAYISRSGEKINAV